ncbi:putative uncharacterized protein DDB_G0282133 isoform X2 [Sipha flava]|uniref:Uncharacterized protein n=2 Tax=Sipha flava TaxID=143950 RepID=A0A8B8FKY2_9HEMI|nr:putative uncharacterized protein DDB_G0282133 isoform X1 [Sipha flava]XP_025411146.1 putative uncharacterized protein DDB_G0282133 isoform X2 [Sipha flava]
MKDISYNLNVTVRLVMVTLKNGFFFFFLSKLFAINCSTTNPINPVLYGTPVNNGMLNSWTDQQPVNLGTTNKYNAYSSNSQGLQPNIIDPNHHQKINYGQQLTTPKEPQSYNFQEQQNLQNPFQIDEKNLVMKDHLKKQQPSQSNLNSVQYQSTNTQYPNHNYINTNYNQPNYQKSQSTFPLTKKQPTESQTQHVKPQSYQFSTPPKNEKEIPQSVSMTISSLSNEYQNQFSLKANQQQPQLSKLSHPSQFKTSEVKYEPYSQYPQDNPSSDQFKSPSLPISSSSKPFTEKEKPEIQNTPQSLQPPKSSLPSQLKPEPYSQYPQNNSSLDQFKSPSLSISSSSKPFTEEKKPDKISDLQLEPKTPSQTNTQASKENVILNSQSNLPDKFNANYDTLWSQNKLKDFNDKISDLESKLKNEVLQIPIKPSETSTNANYIDNAIHSSDIIKSEKPEVLISLAMFDKPNNIDIENPKNTEKENVKFRVFADPNDIYILNSTQSPSSITDKGNLNNNNLLKTQPIHNQMPMDMPNNNYDSILNTYYKNDPYHTFSNRPQDISKNTNQPSSKENSGHIYKQVDLINPSSSVNSWSLKKNDYSLNKRPNQNNGYSKNNDISQTSVFKTPSAYNQNNNQYISSSSLDYISVQNIISIISKAVEAPLDGTKAIFGLTQASFPNAKVIQQLNLTYSVVQSIILSLRKILNTVVNHIFHQRVKRDYSMLSPMSNILPKTTSEPVLNLPTIASLKKKKYQSTSDPNTDSYNNQPKTASSTMIMNTYRQPTAKTGIYLDKPYSQQLLSSISNVDTKKHQKHMYNSEINGANIDYNEYESWDSIRTAQQAPNTRGYVSDMLTNEIRTQVYTNLPDSYSSNSPEVEEYCRQVMFAVEIFFRNQINNVLQGYSPNMNTI